MYGISLTVCLCALINVPRYEVKATLHTIVEDVVSIIYGELAQLVGECKPINSSKIDFLLYNRQYPTNPIKLNPNTYQLLHSNLPTKFLIHGWVGSALDDNIIGIRRAYLEMRNYNVIAVDWSKYAVINYASAHCNLPKVGHIVGRFVYTLIENGHARLNNTHLVGFSMGAHLAAYAGQAIQQIKGEKLARITGLDPAGPLYYGLPANQRLSKEDAEFVDVIHTNGGVFGYLSPIGHVDFYPNCGIKQRGCRTYSLNNKLTLINEIKNDIFCHHNRSNEYFIESISSKKFVAKHCLLCNTFCWFFNKAVMGEYCSTKTRGVYYLKTNKEVPYGKG